MKIKSYIRTYWPLLLPLLLLLPGMSGFPYSSIDARFSDITISHFPNAVIIKKTLLEHHTIPLWSDSILSGYPFAANPLSGLWYPFAWPALLFPLAFGFNLMVMLHMLWGGIGMSALLRRLQLSPKASLLGALAYMLMPKYFAHYGAGHLTLAYALPWTPWLLLTTLDKERKWYSQPGIVLALIFLADVRWAVYAGLFWLVWEFWNRSGKQALIRKTLCQIGIAFLLCAPLGLPLLEYSLLSTRSQMTANDMLELSLQPARLLGLLLPDFSGFHEWMVYPGLIVLCLALTAIIHSSKPVRFWTAVVGVAIFFSLGMNIPGMVLLAKVPGLSLLRVPSRLLFAAGTGWAVLSAYGLEQIMGGLSIPSLRVLRLLLVGLLTFTFTLGIGSWVLTGVLENKFIWSVIALAVFWLWFELRKDLSRSFWVAMVIGFALLDLGLFNRSLFYIHPAEQVLSERRELASYLSALPGDFRVYSPSYSVPQHTAAVFGLKLADGVDPLQLVSYTRYMDKASGVPRQGYSVTLPPFTNGDPATANQGHSPDLEMLYRLGVRYITADYDLTVPRGQYQLTLIEVIDNTRIYAILAEADPSDTIELDLINPNKAAFTYHQGSQFEMPWNDYPGWHAKVDGQPVPLIVEDGLIVGVDHYGNGQQGMITFCPLSVYIGSLLAVVGIFILYVKQKRTYDG